MIWLALIPLAAVVLWLWYPRRAPVSPFPPVTDTVAGFADRTRGERLSEKWEVEHYSDAYMNAVYDQDDGDDAA